MCTSALNSTEGNALNDELGKAEIDNYNRQNGKGDSKVVNTVVIDLIHCEDTRNHHRHCLLVEVT